MIALLRSRLLDVPHGFSTRAGGISDGPYAALNLGLHVGDDPDRVRENGERLRRAAGVSRFACLSQVHGDRVLVLSEGNDGLAPCGTADASITRARDLALGIGTADCLPVLIHAPDVGAVAAAHAGWRGAELGIAARAVEALAQLGADPRAMRAALGPSIRRCCYEVSSELADRFSARFGARVVDRSRPTPHLDLVLASRAALGHAGVPEANIDALEACTHCQPDLFFSHRRDRGRTGRMLSFIALG